MSGITHTDDSGGPVDISVSVPATHRVANAQLRFVVQTDASVQYGGVSNSDPDGREGLTVYSFKGLAASGAQLFHTEIGSVTANTYATGVNEWRLKT